MNKIKRLLQFLSILLIFSFSATNVFADVNLGSDDGTGFGSGEGDNGWGLKTDSGVIIWDNGIDNLEGLRITVYDAETNKKVYNTIDITGNANIAAVSDILYFADGLELIPKTTWLSAGYVGIT